MEKTNTGSSVAMAVRLASLAAVSLESHVSS